MSNERATTGKRVVSLGNFNFWRSRRTGRPGLLKGVRAICDYARISHRTFYTWKNDHGFPVSRLPGGRWCTSKVLIDDWILSRWKAQREQS